jgi:DNA-binding transcriptional LysR family regulator
MGLLSSLKFDAIKAWFRSEAAEVTESVRELESRLDQDLSERERRLDESPSEAVERIQGEIADHESAFDAIRDKLPDDPER